MVIVMGCGRRQRLGTTNEGRKFGCLIRLLSVLALLNSRSPHTRARALASNLWSKTDHTRKWREIDGRQRTRNDRNHISLRNSGRRSGVFWPSRQSGHCRYSGHYHGLWTTYQGHQRRRSRRACSFGSRTLDSPGQPLSTRNGRPVSRGARSLLPRCVSVSVDFRSRPPWEYPRRPARRHHLR
jgi:hypothetical protein